MFSYKLKASFDQGVPAATVLVVTAEDNTALCELTEYAKDYTVQLPKDVYVVRLILESLGQPKDGPLAESEALTIGGQSRYDERSIQLSGKESHLVRFMWDVTTPVEMANTSEVSPNGDHLGTTLKPSDSMKEMEALNSDTNAAHNGAEDGSPTVEGKSGIVSILTSISGTPRKGSFSKEPSALFGFRERKHSLLNPNLLEQNPNDEVHYLPDTPESTVQLEGPVPQTVEEVLQYQLSHFPNCPTIGASDTAAGSPVEEVPDGEKVDLDYFARSTQVTLPSGTAYTNLYTTVSPVLLVNDDRSNVRQIARSRSRESQGLQTGRSGQRHGITWRKGSALQSIKESHEGKTGTMQLAGAEEQLALSPVHSRVLQQESTIENAEGRTIQENHMEALRILKDNAFKALNRRKVVYSK